MIFHECGKPILAEVKNSEIIKLYDAGKFGGKPLGTLCPNCQKPIGDRLKELSVDAAYLSYDQPIEAF